MAEAEGRSSANVINSEFTELVDCSNVLNEHLNEDDNDSDYSPEDDAMHGGVTKQHGCVPKGNQIINVNKKPGGNI